PQDHGRGMVGDGLRELELLRVDQQGLLHGRGREELPEEEREHADRQRREDGRGDRRVAVAEIRAVAGERGPGHERQPQAHGHQERDPPRHRTTLPRGRATPGPVRSGSSTVKITSDRTAEMTTGRKLSVPENVRSRTARETRKLSAAPATARTSTG